MNTATVSNTNLFAMAATYLGDATQWVRIAQLNGLADSVVSGTMTLALPPVDPTATGGIVAIGALTPRAVLPINIFAPVSDFASNAGSSAVAIWNGFNWDDGSMWQ